MSLRLGLALFAAGCTFAIGQTVRYKFVSIDPVGRLRIVQASGSVIFAPKSVGQKGFDSPAVSPDGQTVGWLEKYSDGSNQEWRFVDGCLDLYRDGRITHRIPTEQPYYDWRFWQGGAQVVYATGGEHGGATMCERRDVKSGKLLEQWTIEDHTPLPAWALGFASELRKAP